MDNNYIINEEGDKAKLWNSRTRILQSQRLVENKHHLFKDYGFKGCDSYPGKFIKRGYQSLVILKGSDYVNN